MSGMPLIGSYDYRLVVLSVLIAILAAFAALDLGGRVTSARGGVRLVWLSGAEQRSFVDGSWRKS